MHVCRGIGTLVISIMLVCTHVQVECTLADLMLLCILLTIRIMILMFLHITEVFYQLNSVLEELRIEEFTWDEDINFLQTFVRDSQLQALADLNDHVAQSQSFEQPLGAVSPLCYEVYVSMSFNRMNVVLRVNQLPCSDVYKYRNYYIFYLTCT